jgi:hypothetical protein
MTVQWGKFTGCNSLSFLKTSSSIVKTSDSDLASNTTQVNFSHWARQYSHKQAIEAGMTIEIKLLS